MNSGIRAALSSGYWLNKPDVLPNYRRYRSRLEIVLKKGVFFLFCIFSGLFYGFLYTLLPPFLAIYLAGPLLILALLIIWALPDTGRAPTKLLARLFFLYVGILILWPNYLALQLPGLPWISFRRLVIFPMGLILLICLSVSGAFVAEMRRGLSAAKPLTYMMIGFTLIQILTLAASSIPFKSLNILVDYLFGTTAVFFVAAWVMSLPGQAERFGRLLIAGAIILSLIGVAEYWNQGVLWANYIPSFLKVEDEAVLRTLAGKLRDGRYRVTTIFSVSLSMAEFLALVTPFIIHRLMNSTRLLAIGLWIAADLLLLLAINLTQSRLGILGWIVAHAVYGCVWGFRRWSRTKSDLISPAVSLLYTAGAIVFMVGMFTIPAIRNRTIGGGSSGFSDQGRKEQFALMWPKLFRNPFGYGSGRSGDVLGFYTPGGQLTVDSYLITVLLDYGVLGGLLFFGMFFYAAYKMLQVYWFSNDRLSALALPLACTIVVAIQVRWVLSQTDNLPLLHMFLGMSAAIAYLAAKERGLIRARTQDVRAIAP
ncbi:hypothetical protein HJG53_03395 [Sphingomonas sp. ID1715]|uniref:O-antigen ligase family protein n=1 Tax=Sphingomonas sp. ID1715 TaxID=1656898 RepID=UPI001488378A|nr:O-antigen ligase family protein [Sphingomonas sp. ID1715]NNM75953.1 hypothetical protein [Sphingomonas sp. ID1715]